MTKKTNTEGGIQLRIPEIDSSLTVPANRVSLFRNALEVFGEQGTKEMFVAAAVIDAPEDCLPDEIASQAKMFQEADRYLREHPHIPVAELGGSSLSTGITNANSGLFFEDSSPHISSTIPVRGFIPAESSHGTAFLTPVGQEYGSPYNGEEFPHLYSDRPITIRTPQRLLTPDNFSCYEEPQSKYFDKKKRVLIVGEEAIEGFFAGLVEAEIKGSSLSGKAYKFAHSVGTLAMAAFKEQGRSLGSREERIAKEAAPHLIANLAVYGHDPSRQSTDFLNKIRHRFPIADLKEVHRGRVADIAFHIVNDGDGHRTLSYLAGQREGDYIKHLTAIVDSLFDNILNVKEAKN
jgi:hypothetical protein